MSAAIRARAARLIRSIVSLPVWESVGVRGGAMGLLGLGVALTLTACSGNRSAFEPVAGAPTSAPQVDASSVRIVRADREGVVAPEGASVLGRVTASADARFRSGIDNAQRVAERRLAQAAAEAGATGVVVRTSRVIEVDAGAAELAAPTFEEDRRDRLSPGGAGYAPVPRVFRVILTGDAVVERTGPAVD